MFCHRTLPQMTTPKLQDRNIQFTYATPVTCACGRLPDAAGGRDDATGELDQHTSYPSYDVYAHVNYWHLEGSHPGYVSGEHQLPPDTLQQATVATATPPPMSLSSDSLDENSKSVLPPGDEDDHSKSTISREISGDSSSDFPESAVPPPTKTMSYPVRTTASSDVGTQVSTSDVCDDDSVEPFSEENEDKRMISSDEIREMLSFDAINQAREITFHKTITKGRQSTSAAVISQTRESTSSDEGRRYSSITALYQGPTQIKRSMQNLLDQAARRKIQSAKQNSRIPKRLCSVCGHTKKRVHLTSAQIARAKCIINNTLTECNADIKPASLNEPAANETAACQSGTTTRKKKLHMTSAQIAGAKYIIDSTLTEPNTAMTPASSNESNTNQTRICQYGTKRRKKKKLHFTSAQIARAKYIIDSTLTEPNTAMTPASSNESNTNQTRICQYGTKRRNKKKLHFTSAQIARAKYIIDSTLTEPNTAMTPASSNESNTNQTRICQYGTKRRKKKKLHFTSAQIARAKYIIDTTLTDRHTTMDSSRTGKTSSTTLDDEVREEMLHHLYSREDVLAGVSQTEEPVDKSFASLLEKAPRTVLDKATIAEMLRELDSEGDLFHEHLSTLPRLSRLGGSADEHTNATRARHMSRGTTMMTTCKDTAVDINRKVLDDTTFGRRNTRTNDETAFKRGHTQSHARGGQFLYSQRDNVMLLAESKYEEMPDNTGNRAIISLTSVVNATAGETSAESSDESGGCTRTRCIEGNIHDAESEDTSLSSVGNPSMEYGSIPQKGLNTTTGIGKVHVYSTPVHRRTSITNRKNDTAFSYSKRDHLIQLAESMHYKRRIEDESSQSEDSVGAAESKATMCSSSVDSSTSYDLFGEDNALSTMNYFSKTVRSPYTKSPDLTVVSSTQAKPAHTKRDYQRKTTQSHANDVKFLYSKRDGSLPLAEQRQHKDSMEHAVGQSEDRFRGIQIKDTLSSVGVDTSNNSDDFVGEDKAMLTLVDATKTIRDRTSTRYHLRRKTRRTRTRSHKIDAKVLIMKRDLSMGKDQRTSIQCHDNASGYVHSQRDHSLSLAESMHWRLSDSDKHSDSTSTASRTNLDDVRLPITTVTLDGFSDTIQESNTSGSSSDKLPTYSFPRKDASENAERQPMSVTCGVGTAAILAPPQADTGTRVDTVPDDKNKSILDEFTETDPHDKIGSTLDVFTKTDPHDKTGSTVDVFIKTVPHDKTGTTLDEFTKTGPDDKTGSTVNVFTKTVPDDKTGSTLDVLNKTDPHDKTGSTVDVFIKTVPDDKTGSTVNVFTKTDPDDKTGSTVNDDFTKTVPDDKTGSTVDDFTKTVPDDKTGSTVDVFTKTVPDDKTGSTVDDFTKTVPDDKTGSTVDVFTKTVPDDKTGTTLDEFTKTYPHDKTGSTVDEFTKTVPGDKTGTTLDEFTKTDPHDKTGSTVDEFTKTVPGDKTGTTLDEFTKTVPDDKTGATVDEFTKTVPGDKTMSTLHVFSKTVSSDKTVPTVDVFTKTVTGDNTGTTLDVFTKTVPGDTTGTTLDVFTKTVHGDTTGTTLDVFTKSVPGDTTGTTLDEFTMTVPGDDANRNLGALRHPRLTAMRQYLCSDPDLYRCDTTTSRRGIDSNEHWTRISADRVLGTKQSGWKVTSAKPEKKLQSGTSSELTDSSFDLTSGETTSDLSGITVITQRNQTDSRQLKTTSELTYWSELTSRETTSELSDITVIKQPCHQQNQTDSRQLKTTSELTDWSELTSRETASELSDITLTTQPRHQQNQTDPRLVYPAPPTVKIWTPPGQQDLSGTSVMCGKPYGATRRHSSVTGNVATLLRDLPPGSSREDILEAANRILRQMQQVRS